MSRKIILMLILSFVFTMLPAGVCQAADPTVTREYIARKSEGVKSEEEKVSVDFKDLRTGKGSYVMFTFLDGENSVIYEYEEELNGYEFSQESAFFNSQKLLGTESIRIELFIQEQKISDITVPLKI